MESLHARAGRALRLLLPLLALPVLLPPALAQGAPCAQRSEGVPTELTLAADTAAVLAKDYSQDLRELARETARYLEQGKAPVLDATSAELYWQEIEKLLAGYRLPNTKWSAVVNFKVRFRLLYEDLLERGKIKRLLPEERERICSPLQEDREILEQCRAMRGYYVPLTGDLYIGGSGKEETARTLFHELLHAYQYTYRFPLDVKYLSDAAAAGNLGKDEALKFLSYFYEQQANYQTMRVSPEKSWDPHYKSALEANGKFLAKGWVTSLLFAGMGPLSPFIAAGGIVSANVLANSNLPEISKVPVVMGQAIPGKFAVYWLPELVPLESTSYLLSFVAMDLGFHEKYGKAVQCAYFKESCREGKRPFTGDPLKLTNDLHDQYYRQIGKNETFETEGECSRLVQEVQGIDVGPLVEWLSMPAEKIEACAVYKGAGDRKSRERFAGLVQGNRKILQPDGGEGSRPDLRINPSIWIQPQLVIEPPKKD